jgi:hypothetical protein
MALRGTLQAKVKEWIARQRDDVFLTREFRDLSGERRSPIIIITVNFEPRRFGALPPKNAD